MSEVSSPARSRLAKARWAGAGIADQAVVALANAGNTLLPAALLARERSADMLLAIAVMYFVNGISRAFVGDVLLTMASRHDGETRERLVRDGLCSALALGGLGSVVFVGLWVFYPVSATTDLRDLVWLVPFVPFLLLQDSARYTYLSARRPQNALRIDLVWIGTQITLVLAGLAVFGPTAAGLMVAWGLGAVAGFTVFCVRERIPFWRGSPRRWIVETRHLAGWFTATALVGQVQTLMVTFLTGGLSKTALSGFRAAQTVLLQPVQNFQTAVQGLLVPRLSRLADGANQDPNAQDQFKRQVTKVALAFLCLGVVTVLVLWPVATLVLTHIDKFKDVAPLALPISLQAGIYLTQVPFTAALRGMHRARMLFTQYVIFTTVSLSGFVLGSSQAGLTGAVWGLATGSTIGLAVMVVLYFHSLRGWEASTSRGE